MTQQLISFHGKDSIKRKFLSRVKAHYKADEIKQGFYWENGKGCAVGCTIHGDSHKEYETQLGLPEGLAQLEDRIFENLKNGEAKEWPVKFLSTIKVGCDLEIVGWKFNLWLQVENRKHAVEQKMSQQIIDAIDGVISYLTPVAEGKPIGDKAWSAAESAAWSAARSAAWSAARSAAESAAWSAARSAARSAAESAAWSAARSAARSAAESAAWSAARSAARSAAWSAAESAAWSAARSAAYKKFAKKLLEMLADAPKAKGIRKAA